MDPNAAPHLDLDGPEYECRPTELIAVREAALICPEEAIAVIEGEAGS